MIIISFVVAEYFANRWMRDDDDKDSRFVLKTFGASVFSSFYNLLCALTAFKDDNLFSEKVAVDFNRFTKEHWMRSILSVILSIIALILAVINLTVNTLNDDANDTNSNDRCNGSGNSNTGSFMVFVFIFLFFIALWINKRSMDWIQTSLIDGAETPESVAGDGSAPTLNSKVTSNSEVSLTETIQFDMKDLELVLQTVNSVQDGGTNDQSATHQSEPGIPMRIPMGIGEDGRVEMAENNGNVDP